MQEGYLIGAPTRLSIESWMKGLIKHLLQLTHHAQWIFRDITKHHGSTGSLKLAAQEDVLKEVERQLELGLGSLPPESQFLLEILHTTLYDNDMRTDKQQYWLYAIQAARQAGKNALDASKGTTTSWSAVLKDDALDDLPSHTPPPPPLPADAVKPPPTTPTSPPPSAQSSHTIISRADLAAAAIAKKQVQAFRKRRKTSASRDHTSTLTLYPHTIERDHLNILSGVCPPPHHRRPFQVLLSQRMTRSSAGPSAETIVIRSGSDSIQHSSFIRLNEGIWLNDKPINYNYFLNQIVQPTHEKVHCYSSYFFTALRQRYYFGSVRRWHPSIPDGLFALDSLFVPINRGNNHWLLLHVQPPTAPRQAVRLLRVE